MTTSNPVHSPLTTHAFDAGDVAVAIVIEQSLWIHEL